MFEPRVFNENFILDPGSNRKQGNVLIWEEYSGKNGAHLLVKICMENVSCNISLIYKI